MIVFQKSFDHIVDTLRERANVEPEWLLGVVAEMNLFLPDDWRMTASTNQFRIHISAPEATLALVGSSFRDSADEVIHIVDTVFRPHFISKEVSGQSPAILTSTAQKASHAHRLTPNLYFFRPCPPDTPSPLFGRQYEKVNVREDGTIAGRQFHRLQPLTKAGIDPDHYRWVQWDTNGHVEFVDYTEPGYHGRSYWAVPPLNKKRRDSADAYRAAMHALCDGYGVPKLAAPDLLFEPYRNEYKMVLPASDALSGEILDSLVSVVEELGYRVEYWERRSSSQEDTYFDDAVLTLYNRGLSFCLRDTGEVKLITLKGRLPSQDIPGAHAYRRLKEEVAIARDDESAIRNGERLDAFPCRLLLYLAPDCGRLEEKLRIETQRRRMTIVDTQGEKATITWDRVHYPSSGGEPRAEMELELESDGMRAKDMQALAELLGNALGLSRTTRSRYTRAVEDAGLADATAAEQP